MADKIIVSPSSIRTPPLLAELYEEYCVELKEWMGKWYPEESNAASNLTSDAASNLTSEVDKENKLPCNPFSLSLNKTNKKALHVVTGSAGESHRFVLLCSAQELQQLAEGLKPA